MFYFDYYFVLLKLRTCVYFFVKTCLFNLVLKEMKSQWIKSIITKYVDNLWYAFVFAVVYSKEKEREGGHAQHLEVSS